MIFLQVLLYCLDFSSVFAEKMATFEKFVDEPTKNKNTFYLTPKEPLLPSDTNISAVGLCFRFYYSSFLGTSNFNWFSAQHTSTDGQYALSWEVLDLGPYIGKFLIDQKPFMISKTQRIEIFNEGSRPLRWFSRDTNPVDSGTWHHFCSTYDHNSIHLLTVLNKNMIDNYTFTPLVSKLKGPTPLMFNHYKPESSEGFRMALDNNVKVTDVQVWNRFLTVEEMIAYTSCEFSIKGSVYQWNSSDWTFAGTNVTLLKSQESTVETTHLCSKEKLFLVPDMLKHQEALDQCKLFGGEMAFMETAQEISEISIFTSINIKRMALSFSRIWMRFTDVEENDNFIDVITKQPSKEPIPWKVEEPNGNYFESCTILDTSIGKVSDFGCTSQLAFVCQHVTYNYKLKGLCVESAIDRKFRIAETLMNDKRFFISNYGWIIYWNGKNWCIKNIAKSSNSTGILISSSVTYPVGRFTWNIENDACTINKDAALTLTLTNCAEDEFTCDNGNCVSMEKRCDLVSDCLDISDEKNCKIVVMDATKYLQDKPPEAAPGEKTVTVSVSVNVFEILKVDEVGGIFETQHEIQLSWRDSRLSFYNLKQESFMNKLVSQEKNSIWVPSVTFLNTASQDFTLNDISSYVKVLRKSNLTQVSDISHENAYIYDGDSNPLVLGRVYKTSWICQYDTLWYPFDTQTCKLQFVIDSDALFFMNLRNATYNYTGPMELTQYFIRSYAFKKESEQISIYEFVLGRRLLVHFLTIYLPTLLLNLIGHATNYYITILVCSGKETVGSLPNNLPTHLAPKPNRSRYELLYYYFSLFWEGDCWFTS
ncbi:uncharacterized protein LOC111709412 [Eurytemora carolleeae]|uniref:uncharacterized protein LOC111709412 n=1 Tax=Eurytemora carolleeae TaxID=1294199 RepID=UPI000C7944AC|nr:uncharacterized protein LOC111709412 [Eurytemora carolleeae]|eukprot:XP_023338843.1 uncharacterized protein LOC111709412 [Eurytemora affinis]